MKVLVADDDALSRLLITKTLENIQHTVISVANGREGWEAYREVRPEIVISDWIMPELSGIELCRMIRAEKRSSYTYIVLCTALGGTGSFLEGMSAGADDFLEKPIEPVRIVARVRVAERIQGLLQRVQSLEGLLPVCSYCSKIRDERAGWMKLDEYVTTHTHATVTHGVCHECYVTRLEPELARLEQ